jgi:hypothetical protein
MLLSTKLFIVNRILRKRGNDASHQVNHWYPPALRWWNLAISILLCWTFIAVLQYFLSRSQRDGGVIFAANLNDLPLRRSFSYRYLPTIVAVTFSMFILWIDNDARRYEPYRQMLRPAGALAKDSILLHYPFDFMPLVPFKSFRRRQVVVRSREVYKILANTAQSLDGLLGLYCNVNDYVRRRPSTSWHFHNR